MVATKKSEIIDGYTIKYHANGASIRSKGKIINNKAEGYREWYRKDGTLKRSGFFDQGSPVGERNTYDQQGILYKTSQK